MWTFCGWSFPQTYFNWGWSCPTSRPALEKIQIIKRPSRPQRPQCHRWRWRWNNPLAESTSKLQLTIVITWSDDMGWDKIFFFFLGGGWDNVFFWMIWYRLIIVAEVPRRSPKKFQLAWPHWANTALQYHRWPPNGAIFHELSVHGRLGEKDNNDDNKGQGTTTS